jgi:ribosomal protein S18 acetylase RimI-like enzyme
MAIASMQFRPATINDVASLKELALSSWRQFEEPLGADNWNALYLALDKVNYSALVENACGVVCTDENEAIIGMAFLVPSGNPTDIFPSDWCYVRMVTVNTNCNGMGIGRGLMSACIGRAKTLGETVMGLHSSEIMSKARHIYESMGFKVVRELEERFGKRCWLYRLDL